MRSAFFTPTQVMDKFLTYCRYCRVYETLKKYPVHKIYDLGCGSGNLVRALIARGYEAYGIDVKSGEHIIAADLNHPLPLETASADLITSLANIEHLNEPLLNLKEIYRILRQKGILILTTPSTAAKPVLESMAYRFKIIDAEEIRDHKQYFSKKMLQEYLALAGFTEFQVKRFQFGMNLHAVAIK